MTRYTDYNIDYPTGTFYFRDPVPSKDADFNPIFVVVEYEARDDKDETVIGGGRASLRLFDNRLELGATAIGEGRTGKDGELFGSDLRLDLTDQTRLVAEFAGTATNNLGVGVHGIAYLAELATRSDRLDARAYVREQQSGFGLGQQSTTETGTRKLGLEGGYKLTDQLSLAGEAYRQTNLETNVDRNVVEARSDYQLGNAALFGGYRMASDDGEGVADATSHLLIGGGSFATLSDRLRLRLNSELALGGADENPDFPTRAILGADYELTHDVSLFTEQEFTFGDAETTRSTRMGVRAKPWTGATASTSFEDRLSGAGSRSFANLGLAQNWRINDKWSLDATADHTYTFRNPGNTPFNSNVPPTSGTLNDDFTAISLGSSYRAERWELGGRIETRVGELQDKWSLYTSFVREAGDGVGYSVAFLYNDLDEDGGVARRDADLRLGVAFRPVGSRWIVLNRMDLVAERETGGSFDFDNRKIINNVNVNYQWTPGLQVSLLYGAKYVVDTIDGTKYDGFVDIWGLELRRDLGGSWDVGLAARTKHSWGSDVLEHSYGLELGRKLRTNMWVSLGYNFAGFRDDDFSAAEYTYQGPYLKFRYKFDQQTIRDILKGRRAEP